MFPAVYARHGGDVVVLTPKTESNWWRNFDDSRPCTLWLRGVERSAVGTVLTGGARADSLAAYVDRHRLVGRHLAGDGNAPPNGSSDPAGGLAAVRFTPLA